MIYEQCGCANHIEARPAGYAVGNSRIFGSDDSAIPPTRAITASQAYNAELVKKLTPLMQGVIATKGAVL